jgi:SNF2 family DNA or RNA helicase
MEIKFYKQQRQTIEFGKKNPYSIYALEQGVGKSLCALATAHETNSKMLIVCPSYLMYKLKSEAKKFYPEKTVSLLENDRQFYALWDTDIAIISYHFVGKAEILFEWADLVVFDEGQYLKNMEAKRTEAAHKLIYENSIKRCLILTGTPIENRVYEFYSLIALCNYDPRIKKSEFLERFPTYVDFANHFSHLTEFDVWNAVKQKMVRTQKWDGIRNVDELKDWLKPHYIRFRLDEVVELPAWVNIDVPVEYKNNPELQLEFDKFMAGGEYNSVNSPVKVKAALATAAASVEYAKGLLDQGLPVVIYSCHPEAAEFIADKLEVRHIDGTTPKKLRQDMADAFQRGETDKIVATIDAFSTGIDLYRARDMIFNDISWKPSSEDQARSRIRRIGQTGKCRYHYIIGTYQYYYIRDKVSEKREIISQVI